MEDGGARLSFKERVSQYWFTFQQQLFPWLEEELGDLHRKLVSVQELVRIEEALPGGVRGGRGRPLADRAALARVFVAKAVFNLPTTRALVERLGSDPALRRICGWDLRGAVPSEATFSRAFAAFAASDLPGQLHKAQLCLLYTSPSPRDATLSRMPSSA